MNITNLTIKTTPNGHLEVFDAEGRLLGLSEYAFQIQREVESAWINLSFKVGIKTVPPTPEKRPVKRKGEKK